MSQRTKLALAVALMSIGAVLLGVRFWPVSRRQRLPPEHDRQHEAPAADTENAAAYGTADMVKPTLETIDSVVDQVVETVRAGGLSPLHDHFLSTQQRDALMAQVREHLRFMLTTSDVKTYDKWITAHGGYSSLARAIEEGRDARYRADVEGRLKVFRLIALAPQLAQALPHYQSGVALPVDRRPVKAMYTEPNTFGLPMDAEKAGLTVYEIRVPAMIPGIPADPETGAPMITNRTIYIPGELGMAYAWDESRKEWRPWRHWVYCATCDGHEFYAGPRFP